MSETVDLSRVLALANKGHELLMGKGHYARAAEKFRLATEEAEKALPGPDSLVTCLLRHDQLAALMRHATSSAARPADADDAVREAGLRLLPSVMAALDRRKAAGTLLPGSCRPEEEAYQMAAARHSMELQGCTRARTAEQATRVAPYIGVGTYVLVASGVAYMLNEADKLAHAYVLSDEQKNAGHLFVASALDLMRRPRDCAGATWLSGESELVRQLRILFPKTSDTNNPATQKLCAAWRRVLRSGVVSARCIDLSIDALNQRHLRTCAAADAEVAAGRLQQCALAGCAARESHASQFKRCGACRAVCYCCREHQVEDWPSHKAACKAARKASSA
jgi:hypothetical protein